MSEGKFGVSEARKFYDRFGAKQDAQGWYEDPATELLVQKSDFGSAERVVEFGCGTGRFADRLLADVLGTDALYRGYDLSTTMVDLARERLAEHGTRAGVVLTDGSMELDEREGTVDRVVANYVLDLLGGEQIRAFLKEAHRVLKADGRLCVVSLTYGNTLISKAVSALWSTVRGIRPSIVGGCRPVILTDFVGEPKWEVIFDEVVVASGVPSEVLIAKPVKAGG